MSLSQDIKHKTIELGFDLVGITSAAPIAAEQAAALAVWLKSGFAGDLDYMHRNLQKRLNPAKLAREMKRVVEEMGVEIKERSVVTRVTPGSMITCRASVP